VKHDRNLFNFVEEPDRKWLVTGPSNSPENALRLPDGRAAHVCLGPTVDIAWKDGKVARYRIAAKQAQPVKVRVNGEVRRLNAELVGSVK
jgi:hypothetical protein